MIQTLEQPSHTDAEDARPLSPAGIVGRTHTSRFIGVGWDKRRGRWHAQIIVSGRFRYLGTFEDEACAARAYDQAAREAHGGLATLNFPTAIDRERAAAWIGRHAAHQRFGVGLKTWERWEREGRIQCGVRIGHASKMYRITDIERLLEENGSLQPPYPDPERLECYRVPLTGQGIRRREAIIDAESLPLVQGKQWCWGGSIDAGKGGVVQARQGNMVSMRRVIMGVVDVPTDEVQVTHANGDLLDYRRENLILRTIKQRVTSSRKRKSHHGKPCSSKYKGVCWNAKNSRWKATIHSGGKAFHLGFFSDEMGAAEAYDDAARKHFGEHAWLNFPDEGERGMANQQDADELSLPPVRMAA